MKKKLYYRLLTKTKLLNNLLKTYKINNFSISTNMFCEFKIINIGNYIPLKSFSIKSSYFQRQLLKTDPIDILCNIRFLIKLKFWKEEDLAVINEIENTFKAIKLNNKLEEEITTNLKTKKVKI